MRFVEDSPHPVELVLRVLGIASSTYYWWRKRLREPSARQIADAQLLAEIVDIHTSSGGTYGSPRVHAMLARRGVAVGRKRVERVMRGAGLQGGIERIRLATGGPIAVAIPRHRKRVDREYLPSNSAQTSHQQTTRSLDRDRQLFADGIMLEQHP
ncbi:IS3 family transposase [Nocardia higoensis]|uniref:IS3 family transposase n=1 Tax=Nocardia higoensis TaxID=228599 RepID=A0ABS0D4E7_9NOCA|nr:IS3 family transposase [Nocardia higoensis]MBF6353367.1 IS3 family transposase [Nocardia higoensis]